MTGTWRSLIPRRSGGGAGTPLRLRLRLTLFYGVLSIVSGVALLVLTYLLLSTSQDRSAVGSVNP
jgi:hypothetical protein